MSSIRVLIVDDHTILRAGIRSLLEDMAGIEVIAEASDGVSAWELVEAHRPDIALADITMPGLGGLDFAAKVARKFPNTKVVILTMHKDKEYIRRAVEVGAAGYLLKGSDTEELERALREVAQGGNYLSPEVSQHLVIAYKRPPERTPYPGIPLTRRQFEVLKLIAEGKTTKSIARSLGISAKTVEAHRTLLMERLGIFDIAGLVRYAFRIGMITTEK